MKAIKFIKSAYIIMASRSTAPMMALTAIDLTQDKSGGKKFSDVANNINEIAQTGASLLIQLVSIGGFVVVALSLYQIYKASKDEREKPMSAIVGMFVGGLMASVGTVMWIMKSSLVG